MFNKHFCVINNLSKLLNWETACLILLYHVAIPTDVLLLSLKWWKTKPRGRSATYERMTMIFYIGCDVSLTVDAARALSYLIWRFTTYQDARRVKLVDGLDDNI